MTYNDEGPSPPAWWPKTMTPADMDRIDREFEEKIKALPQCYHDIALLAGEEIAARIAREHSKDWDFFRRNPERRYLVRRCCDEEPGIVFYAPDEFLELGRVDAAFIAIRYLGTRLEMKSFWAPCNLEPEVFSEDFCQILFDGAHGGGFCDLSNEYQPRMSFIAELDEGRSVRKKPIPRGFYI